MLNESVSHIPIQQLLPLSVAYLPWRHLAFQVTPYAIECGQRPFFTGESSEQVSSHFEDVFSLGIFLQQEFIRFVFDTN